MKPPHTPHVWQSTRREFLYVGLLGTVGMTMSDLLRGEARAATAGQPLAGPPKAKSVINIYLPGGISHQESFDPKLTAPVEYRGPMEGIKTSIDGVYFSENLKETAKIADKLTVVRSMTHGEAAHERGTHNMFTGYRPSPALQFPSFGSVVSHEFGSKNNMPPYVCVPSMPNTYAGSGYLSSAYGPFSLGSDPASGGFRVRDLDLPGGIDDGRFDRRRTMLDAVDSHFRKLEKSDNLAAMDSFYQRAYGLISSKAARQAFDINAESDATKEAYGRNEAGMRFLMCRRLVEAGVRFVSTTYSGWDHHV